MALLQGCAGPVPVDNVDEFPGIPYELELKLAPFVCETSSLHSPNHPALS